MSKLAFYSDKRCVVCGAVFTPANGRAKSCQTETCKEEMKKETRRKYREARKEHTRLCLVCGNEFQLASGRQKLCGSAACRKARYSGLSGKVERKLREAIPEDMLSPQYEASDHYSFLLKAHKILWEESNGKD